MRRLVQSSIASGTQPRLRKSDGEAPSYSANRWRVLPLRIDTLDFDKRHRPANKIIQRFRHTFPMKVRHLPSDVAPMTIRYLPNGSKKDSYIWSTPSSSSHRNLESTNLRLLMAAGSDRNTRILEQQQQKLESAGLRRQSSYLRKPGTPEEARIL